MFEEQDNQQGTDSSVKPRASAAPMNLPGAEPEDVLATVDPAKGASSRQASASTYAATPGIPEEYLQNNSGRWKRIAVVVGAILVVSAIAVAGYWFFALRQPATPEVVEEAGPGVVNATSDLKPQGANPKDFNDDSDADSLSVENEETAGTDVNNPDTDGDGLFDGEEVRIYGTNPLSVDTDSDTFSDADEVRNGFNPKGEGRLFNVPQ
ncbi:MAG: hypothetical protein WC052_05410 [Patescibacteria group bacterium]|jgi:hypothetical protein